MRTIYIWNLFVLMGGCLNPANSGSSHVRDGAISGGGDINQLVELQCRNMKENDQFLTITRKSAAVGGDLIFIGYSIGNEEATARFPVNQSISGVRRTEGGVDVFATYSSNDEGFKLEVLTNGPIVDEATRNRWPTYEKEAPLPHDAFLKTGLLNYQDSREGVNIKGEFVLCWFYPFLMHPEHFGE